MQIMLIPVLAAAYLAAFSCSTSASPLCLPHSEFDAQLAEKYREHPAYGGVTRGGALLKVYKSKAGETWTIAVQMPNGLTCLLSAGEGWRGLEGDWGQGA